MILRFSAKTEQKTKKTQNSKKEDPKAFFKKSNTYEIT